MQDFDPQIVTQISNVIDFEPIQKVSRHKCISVINRHRHLGDDPLRFRQGDVGGVI